jgi:predicted CoA-substrate-specific enzyme activase
VIHAASAATGIDPAASCNGLFEAAKAASGGGSDIKVFVTGYGRKLLSGLGPQKTEISCHAAGAMALVTGSVAVRPVEGAPAGSPPRPEFAAGFTLLDIGGQDSKAIRVDAQGRAADFAMNDKCAAGTGRFLEVIGRTLGFGVSGLTGAALASSRRARLSSMCTVFADSEVVSLIARGEAPGEIAWAACHSVAERCAGFVKRVGFRPAAAGSRPVLVFTGGVSEIRAVGDAISQILDVEIFVPTLARFSGAVGAALFAGR